MYKISFNKQTKLKKPISMTITSSLRFLYIFGGSGLLCGTPMPPRRPPTLPYPLTGPLGNVRPVERLPNAAGEKKKTPTGGGPSTLTPNEQPPKDEVRRGLEALGEPRDPFFNCVSKWVPW